MHFPSLVLALPVATGHPLNLYYFDSRVQNQCMCSFIPSSYLLHTLCYGIACHLPAATGSLQSFKKSIKDINFNYALPGKY